MAGARITDEALLCGS